jgi:hypothetical protein
MANASAVTAKGAPRPALFVASGPYNLFLALLMARRSAAARIVLAPHWQYGDGEALWAAAARINREISWAECDFALSAELSAALYRWRRIVPFGFVRKILLRWGVSRRFARRRATRKIIIPIRRRGQSASSAMCRRKSKSKDRY